MDKRIWIVGGAFIAVILFFGVYALINTGKSDNYDPIPTLDLMPDECYTASNSQIDAISDFIYGDYFLSQGYRKSLDDGYYIAAKVYFGDQSDPIGIGVWYVFGTTSNPRSVLVINDIGKKATPNLTLAVTTDFGFRMSDDEAKYVSECAENN